MNVSVAPTVVDRLKLTLEGLCRAVAARIAGRGMPAWMIVLVWQRVRRAEVQLCRLLMLFRRDRLVVRVGVSRGVAGLRLGRGSGRLPRRFGWLVPLVPQDAACFAGQLRSVLAEPEMVALLAASAQARRAVGPLCRMLGISVGDAAGGRAVPAVVAAGGPPVSRTWSVRADDGEAERLAAGVSPWRGSG